MKNPIPELVNDKSYQSLIANGIINETAVRDYLIKRRFAELKKTEKATKAIELISEEHPELEYDTVRKIIYRTKRK